MSNISQASKGTLQVLDLDLGDPRMQFFIELPWKIYGKEFKWVPPLKDNVKLELSQHNPFFKHADARAFLVKLDGEIVARCLATIDRTLMTPAPTIIGYLGYFECIDDVNVGLLQYK